MTNETGPLVKPAARPAPARAFFSPPNSSSSTVSCRVYSPGGATKATVPLAPGGTMARWSSSEFSLTTP